VDKGLFTNLNFNRPARVRLAPRSIFLIGVLVLYLVAWWVIPASTLMWLGLPFTLCLAWAASYGGRQVLGFIQRIINLLETL